MATFQSVWTPNYQDSKAIANLTGTLATTASTGPLTVGKSRIIRIFAFAATTAPVPVSLRYSLGISTGTTAPTPTAAMPFFFTNQVIEIELGSNYDQINFTNLAADNGAVTLNYSISVMSRS